MSLPTAANLISGDIGEADVLAGKQVRDVTKGFYMVYEKNQYRPILALQQAAAQAAQLKMRATNIKKEWTLKDFFPRWDTVSAITSGNGTGTIVLTPTTVALYRVGSTVMFFGGSGGDTVYGVVTAVSTTITVESITGDNFPTLAVGNPIYRYSDSMTELSTLPTPKNVKDSQEYNYVQFMRAPVTIGVFEMGTEQYTGDEEQERRDEQELEIHMNFERNMLWGERGKKTLSSKTAGFMRGTGRYTEVLGGDNILDWDGVNLTETQFRDWLMESTKYGSMTKMFPCSATLFRKISSFSETKERIIAGNTAAGNSGRTLGMHFVNYMGPNGKLLKMFHHHLMEEQHEGFGQIIDIPFLDVMPFGKHQLFEYHEGVHDPDLAGVSNEFWSLGTLQVRRPEVNALIRVV